MQLESSLYVGYIILIMGFAGCGKHTVGQEIAKHSNFILVDNHTISNPILSVIKPDTKHAYFSNNVRDKINGVRQIVLSTIEELSEKDQSFVFTSELIAGTKKADNYLNSLQKTTNTTGRKLVPVRLLCDEEELVKRVQSP